MNCFGIFKTTFLSLLIFVVFQFSYAKENYKIGVVNFSYIVEAFSESKGIQQMLEKEFAPKDLALRKISDDIKKKQEEYALLTSEADKSRLEREILNLDREYSRLGAEFRQDFNLRRNEELFKIQKQITEMILTYAEENNFDLILSSGVLYAKNTLQISDDVLDQLKKTLK